MHQIHITVLVSARGEEEMAHILLENAHNTRDLGEIVTECGVIRHNRLIRSGELHNLTKQDCIILTDQYQLSNIIDFRNLGETQEHPDTTMDNVTYTHLPILPHKVVGVSKEKSSLSLLQMMQSSIDTIHQLCVSPTEYMQGLYRQLVLNPYSASQYGKFCKMLLNNRQGATLWHCSVGKDRAGVGCALLLKLLGASQTTIFDNYMETLLHISDHIDNICNQLSSQGMSAENVDICRYTLSVNESYLATVFDTIDNELGGWDNFVHQHLNLTHNDIVTLISMYIE